MTIVFLRVLYNPCQMTLNSQPNHAYKHFGYSIESPRIWCVYSSFLEPSIDFSIHSIHSGPSEMSLWILKTSQNQLKLNQTAPETQSTNPLLWIKTTTILSNKQLTSSLISMALSTHHGPLGVRPKQATMKTPRMPQKQLAKREHHRRWLILWNGG